MESDRTSGTLSENSSIHQLELLKSDIVKSVRDTHCIMCAAEVITDHLRCDT